MKFFFEALVHSVYDIPWLSARRGDAGRAWGYFFLFIFLVSLSIGIPAARGLVRAGADVRRALETQAPNFAATMENGELNVTGLPQPFVWSPEGEEKSFAFIVDMAATSTIPARVKELETAYPSFLLLSRDRAVVREAASAGQSDSAVQERTFFWTSVKEPVRITKETVLSQIDRFISGPIRTAVYAGVLGFFFVAMAMGKLAYLALVAAVLRIAAAVGKKPLTFGNIYAVGLFAVTLPTILSIAFSSLGVYVPVYTPVLALLMIAALWRKEPSAPSQPAQPPA